MDGVTGISTGAGSVELRLADEKSVRLKEAPIMPQIIGLSRSINQSIDQATATSRLAIVAKSVSNNVGSVKHFLGAQPVHSEERAISL